MAGSAADINAKRQFLLKYGKESMHNVISRKDNLMLSPDKPASIPEDFAVAAAAAAAGEKEDWAKNVLLGKTVSAATLRNNFELGDILEYIKTGIGSVIEDEVTQRFVAEELKVRSIKEKVAPFVVDRSTYFLRRCRVGTCSPAPARALSSSTSS